ncbi:hypothetical protein N0Y54_09975 [Nostoc punctiforme UO1]
MGIASPFSEPEIIREYNVQQIDLLKVGVKRSELDVLLGVKEQD